MVVIVVVVVFFTPKSHHRERKNAHLFHVAFSEYFLHAFPHRRIRRRREHRGPSRSQKRRQFHVLEELPVVRVSNRFGERAFFFFFCVVIQRRFRNASSSSSSSSSR